jgi:DNA-binding NarL/FixJ family response regulator
MTRKATTRVLLADDHVLIVEAVRLLVERIEGVKVIGTAHDGREAVRLAKTQRPDIVIMDIGMKDLNGIDAAMQIREALPKTRVLILSSYGTEPFVERAIRAGVDGYLVKDSMPSELVAAMKALMEGRSYLSPAISGQVMTRIGRGKGKAGTPLEAITARQREILQLLAEGNSTKEIAHALGLSVKTIETHRAALMARLGIRDLAGLVLFAVRHGLVDIDRFGT